MHWTEPATADDSHAALKPSEYSPAVLGLILNCGDKSPLSRRDMSRAKRAVVPAQSEGANVGQAVNEAMRAIEKENPDLADVLPKSYHTRGEQAGGDQGSKITSFRSTRFS